MVLRRIVYGVLNMVAYIAPNCALRAPTVFGTNKKRIRTENTVLDKNKDSSGVYTRSPIAGGCAFHPPAIGDPRGRAAVRASSSATVRSILQSLSMSTCDHCALRAPTLFSVRMKSVSVQKTRFRKKQGRFGLLSGIDDPRGRAAVRAIAEMDDVKASRPDSFGFVRQGY